MPQDGAFLRANPKTVDWLIERAMESFAVTTAGISAEVSSFAAPSTLDLDAVKAPIVSWHGDADVLASAERLQTYLGSRVTERRLFPAAGSMILWQHWTGVLDRLASDAAGR